MDALRRTELHPIPSIWRRHAGSRSRDAADERHVREAVRRWLDG